MPDGAGNRENRMKQIRLDKYLADMGVGTRSQVKNLIRKGKILVNDEVVKTPEYKVGDEDKVLADGVLISYLTYEYLMLNKPAGVVSATEDRREQTVLELITDASRKDLFPVGRLDKDTEGLLLLTNDGALAHDLLSPKKHVDKCYYAKVRGEVTAEDVQRFADGLDIGDEKKTLPAILEILDNGSISEVKVTICEGRYHQIKRMFEAVDKEVLYLKRFSMGPLLLDETLKPGAYRRLTDKEIAQLKERRD